MILKGKKLQEPNKTVIVLPRGENDDEAIVLIAQAILDMEEFDALCQSPKAPLLTFKGGERRLDLDDPRYIAAMEKYSEMRVAYIIIKSLQATPELEWETIELNKPETWLNYEKELKQSGFSHAEVQRIIMAILEVNALSDTKITKARESFLAGRAAQNGSSSHNTAANGMPSGEPANS